MLGFLYWISGIAVSIALAYFPARWLKRRFMKKIRIQQNAKTLRDVKGVGLELTEGDPIHIENLDVTQVADYMQNVTGLAIKATGDQSARLQGIRIQQPGAEVRISDDPSMKVEINKRD